MAAKRMTTPADDARFLAMIREGRTYRDVSLLSGVSVRTVVVAVRRAKALQKKAVEPEPPPAPRQPDWTRNAVVNFGSGPFVPGSPCAHVGPYPKGSDLYCPRCHISGRDGAPALRRDPATEPKPEPKPQSKSKPKSTRRERRADAA
jgi:hypothetical protein